MMCMQRARSQLGKLPFTKAHTATLIYRLDPYFPGDLNSIFGRGRRRARLERETGIEPATNGLGSRDSTTELLPLVADNSIASHHKMTERCQLTQVQLQGGHRHAGRLRNGLQRGTH